MIHFPWMTPEQMWELDISILYAFKQPVWGKPRPSMMRYAL